MSTSPALNPVIRGTTVAWTALTLLSIMLSARPNVAPVAHPALILGCWLAYAGAASALTISATVRYELYAIVALVTATIATADIASTGPGMPIAAVWLTGAAITAALVLPTRAATWTVALIGIVHFVAGLLAVVQVHTVDGILEAGEAAAGTVALGMAATTALAAVVHTAAGYERAHRHTAEETAAAAAQAHYARTSQRAAALLHDTAVNTFAAVGTGITGDHRSALRDRARHDLAALDTLADTTGAVGTLHGTFPDALIALVTSRAGTLGLTVAVDTADTRRGPAHARAAAADAIVRIVDEALLNVAKHSGVTDVSLTIHGTATEGSLEIADTGVGFAMDGATVGGAQPLVQRAQRGGLDATVTSAPGAGTTVRINWNAPTPEQDPTTAVHHDTTVGGLLTTAMAAVIARVGLWLGGYYTFVIATSIMEQSEPTNSARIAALLATTLLCTIALHGVHHRPNSTQNTIVAVMVAAIAVVTLAPAIGLHGCAVAGPEFWEANTGTLLTVAVIGLARNRWLRWTGIATFAVAGALPAIEALTLGGCGNSGVSDYLGALIVVGAFIGFRSYMALLTRRFAIETSTQADTVAAAAAAAHYAFLRHVRSVRTLTRARSLLAGLASGELDPTSAPVRHTAEVEEAFLRSTSSLPVGGGEFGDAIMTTLTRAADAGLLTRVSVLGTVGGGCAQGVLALGAAIIDACTPGTLLTFGLWPGGTTTLTVVVDDTIDLTAEQLGCCCGQSMHVTAEQLPGQTRIQARWSSTPARTHRVTDHSDADVLVGA